MATDIYVVSGFLGAGKTSFIQKLLKEAFQNKKVVLIENDFGELSVDAALLKSGGIEVKEMNSGCICCSLSGDFVKSLKELLGQLNPDKIIIEPSGVGKLSDIVKACSDPSISSFAAVKSKITIVDLRRCKMYLENFGEFFEDQIENADTILLSRTEDFPHKIEDTYRIIRSLNTDATIFSKPWDQIRGDDILHSDLNHSNSHHHSHCQCNHHGTHGDCDHGHSCSCDHDHLAEEVFETITIRTKQVFNIRDLKAKISHMERSTKGTILRAKGILPVSDGYVNLQYLPGEIRITECNTIGNTLSIIGQNLDSEKLHKIFHGE